MRTPEDKYIDMALRGRTPEQIRAVAVARDDKDLMRYLVEEVDGAKNRSTD